jgi:hypothetical protein
MSLERSPLSLVSTIETLLGRKSSGSSLEIREYGHRYPSRWPLGILYPRKLTLTSPTSGGVTEHIYETNFIHGLSYVKTPAISSQDIIWCSWNDTVAPRSLLLLLLLWRGSLWDRIQDRPLRFDPGRSMMFLLEASKPLSNKYRDYYLGVKAAGAGGE